MLEPTAPRGGALLAGLAACAWLLTPMRRIEAQVRV